MDYLDHCGLDYVGRCPTTCMFFLSSRGLLDPISPLETTRYLNTEENFLVWDTVHGHLRDWVHLMSRYNVTGNKAKVTRTDALKYATAGSTSSCLYLHS